MKFKHKIIKCESGSYLAYYLHRSDILANGETEKEALDNLKEMYEVVIEFEKNDQNGLNINPPKTGLENIKPKDPLK